MRRYLTILLLSLLISFPSNATDIADDISTLSTLLDEFLAGQTKAHHQRFWADDLVYTSSSGTRFGKEQIIASYDDENVRQDPTGGVAYSGVDKDIRIYGNIAVVAFKLVAADDDEILQTYFNTGTFIKRDGEWRAVAWQATKIPQD